MSNDANNHRDREISLINIDGGKLHYIAKHIYKISFNPLSPFAKQPEAGAILDDSDKELIQDDDFKSIAHTLAMPSLKISFRQGGPASSYTAFAVYAQKHNKGVSLVSLHNNEGALSAFLFSSIEQYAKYFMANIAAPVLFKPVNALKTEQSLEMLVFIFTLIDCFRRAYLNNLLEYSSSPVEALYEDELIAILEKELKTPDVRWLVPCLFNLVPGFENARLDFDARHVELAEAMDFITRTLHPQDKRPVYLLGSNAKYMGLEFSLLWKSAYGFEVISEVSNNHCCNNANIERFFFAPTDEANHLFRFIETGSGIEYAHISLSSDETAEEISDIINRHL